MSRSLGGGFPCYSAIDQIRQVIDVLVAPKQDPMATRRFCTRVLSRRTHDAAGGGCLHQAGHGQLIKPPEWIQPATT